jgi:hypothetical protein
VGDISLLENQRKNVESATKSHLEETARKRKGK